METIKKPNVGAQPTKVVEPKEPVYDDGSSPLQPEKKDPNTKVSALKGTKLRDGGRREWSWSNLPLSEEPMWQIGRKVLGLDDSQAIQNQNEIADIMKLTLEELQTEDPIEIGKFLRRELRYTPTAGNRLYNLLHNLVSLRKEKDNEK